MSSSPNRKRARRDEDSGRSEEPSPLLSFPLGVGGVSSDMAAPSVTETTEGDSPLIFAESSQLGAAIEGAVKGIMMNRHSRLDDREEEQMSDVEPVSDGLGRSSANTNKMQHCSETSSDVFVVHCAHASETSQLPLVSNHELVICSDDTGVSLISPCRGTREVFSKNIVESICISKQDGNKTLVKINFHPENDNLNQTSNFEQEGKKLELQDAPKIGMCVPHQSAGEDTLTLSDHGKLSSTDNVEEKLLLHKKLLKNLGQIVASDIYPQPDVLGEVKDDLSTPGGLEDGGMEGYMDSDSDSDRLGGSSPSLDSNSLPSFSGDSSLMDPLGMALFTSTPTLTNDLIGLQSALPSTPSAAEMNITITDDQCVYEGGQRRWKCKECDKSYTTKHNLINHMMGHRGLKPHCCQICGKFFKQVSHLSTHMLTHSQTRPHKCDICQRTFTQTSHMKRHMTIHMERRPHVCNICNRGFAFPGELKAHMEKHDKPADSSCDECDLSFESPRKLKQHKVTVHRCDTDLTCEECGKVFTYPSQLRDHMVKHTGYRPFMCSECGMEFMKEHHLKAHLFTHTGLKPWVCPVCVRAFNQKANMQRHMLIHGTQKLFKCEVCEKEFSQPQTLKAHMITHAERKPFQCSICGKEFGRLHNLQGHMHIHKDTKPHVCFCGASFTLKGNLTRHRKVKHGLDDSGECTDEEAAKILNSMSARQQIEDVLDRTLTDEEGGTPVKKSRKSVPRKLAKDENSEDELDEDWEELERQEDNGEEPERQEANGEEPEEEGEGGEEGEEVWEEEMEEK